MNQTLEAARRYVAAGLSVIPLRAKDKLPLPGFGWKEYATRYATSGELYQWFNNTDYNIALATGELSKVVIIDTDNAEAEMTARRLKITSPLQVLTGKGRHHYFKHPGESVKNAVRKLPGLDIRGDNGYALLPPSIHPSGRTYMWASPFLPAVLNRLPLFPVSTFHVKEENKILGLRQINGWIGQAISGIKEGNRNDTFTRIVGRLHRDNWIESDILALLQPLASHVGLSARELEATVHSVLKYANTPKSLGGDNGGLRLHTFKTSADEYATRRAGRGGGNPDNPTGFPVLDKFIGGLIRREIFTVAARTGTGKTSFLIRLCSNLCASGKKVLYFSTEMSFDEIWARYIPVTPSYEAHDFTVCDDFTPDLRRIAETIKNLKPDVFVFDHINIIGDDPGELSGFMKGLKEIAKENGIPCVLAAQLSRLAEWTDQKTGQKIPPDLHMLKGSGTLEEASAQVLLLHEIGVGIEQNEITGYLRKNRYGSKGVMSFLLRKQPLDVVEL